MQKRRVPMTLSVPPDLAKDYNELARKEAKNKSELFRDMFRIYRAQSLKEEFYKLQRYGAAQARKQKIFTEEQVDKILMQWRRKR